MKMPKKGSANTFKNCHKQLPVQKLKTYNGHTSFKFQTRNYIIFTVLSRFEFELPVPFVIYAEFEAITQKIDSYQTNDENFFSEKYQKHKDCEYG